MGATLQLEVKTEWDEMSDIFERTVRFFEEAGLNEDAVNSCTMTVCELVENGIKYGDPHDGHEGTVRLSVSVNDRTVTVQVTSAIGQATRTYLQELDRTVQWVRGYQDPYEAFIERTKEISREPLNLQKSGLGIVRVAYEGHAALDFFLGEDDTLSVLAVSRI